MKITYLGTQRHYKPEYDIADFTRINGMEDYNPFTVIKLMKALYPIRLNENWPEYNEVLEPNQTNHANQKNLR